MDDVTHVEPLKRLIERREARIGIMGMGYVGLPLMLAATAKSFRVIGFDIDSERVDELNQGKSPLKHIPSAAIENVSSKKMFEATADLSRLDEPDIIAICVPTPLGRHQEPDLSFVVETTRAIARKLRRRAARHSGIDHLSGNDQRSGAAHPGGKRAALRRRFLPGVFARARGSGKHRLLDQSHSQGGRRRRRRCAGPGEGLLWKHRARSVVEVSSTETAEAVKITENVFRAVNIALVNELKLVFTRMGIDVFEVIEAAKTKPFGFMPFYPGPGLGGHCIPIDPFYLTWKAREYGINTRFIELAGEINSVMPHYVVSRAAELLDARKGLSLSQAKILMVGVAYKKNVDDTRESPALNILEILQERGAKVDFHDPHVMVIPETRRHPKLTGMKSVALDPAAIGRYDVVLDHH